MLQRTATLLHLVVVNKAVVLVVLFLLFVFVLFCYRFVYVTPFDGALSLRPAVAASLSHPPLFTWGFKLEGNKTQNK